MSNAIEHFSRTRVENTTLQVIADRQRDLDCLIREEESVIRHYIEHGTWPHKLVNMFVFENLEPLVSQIKSAAVLPPVVADDIDRRPMVNIYDAADLTECTIFVNRRALEKDGVWSDAIALRALLAHEHGHPLAENETVRAARELSVEVKAESRTANGGDRRNSSLVGRPAVCACAAGSIRERDRHSRRIWRRPASPRPGCGGEGPIGCHQARIAGAKS